MRTDSPGTEGYVRKPLPTLRDLVAVVFRQRRIVVATFLLVLVAAAGSGKWVPTYEAKMKILALRQRSDAIVSSSESMPAPFNGDQISEEDLNSEVELLNSGDLLRRVVIATGLAKETKGKSQEVAIASAVRTLGQELKVEAGRKSNVITVSYTNKDPRLAARVLQALSTAYTQKHLEMHHASGQFGFFDQQAQQYLKGLDEAQSKLTDFSKDTGVVSAQTERDNALSHANEFDSAARQAHASVVETQQRVATLEMKLRSVNPRMTTTIRTADNPELMQQFKSTLLNLELKRTELLTKYQPTYRLVQEVDRQIADAKASIASETAKPLRDEATDQNPNYSFIQQELTKAQEDLNGLRARETAANSIAAIYHATAQRLDREQLEQQQLQQDVKLQEDNYLLYSRKREEARINDALDQRGIVNVTLAEAPVVPALPTQSLSGFVITAVFGAAFFGLVAAFAFDFLDPTFRTPDELFNYFNLPVLAALPKPVE